MSWGLIYFKFSTILIAIMSACSLVAFAYPFASSSVVVFLGANLLSPTPFMMLFAAIKYTLSFAQSEMSASSAKSAGFV